jgi:hypothetical protein
MRVAIAISAALALAGASAAQAGFWFTERTWDLAGPNKRVQLFVVNDGSNGTGTDWLGQTIVYNNPNVPVFWRTSGALAARQYNGGGNPNSSDPFYDQNFSHINAVPQTAAAADVRPFVASAFVNGVPATGSVWGAAAGITNFSIDFAATGDAADFIPSAATPFNFATLVVPDTALFFGISGLVGGRTGGSVPYSYLISGFGGPIPTFANGVLLGSDARQSLRTTGDDPTIYTLTVDFSSDSSTAATFALDTKLTFGGRIATYGLSPSPFITDLSAVGSVISGKIDGRLRTSASFDIALTATTDAVFSSSRTQPPRPDTAILRIIAIPEPATMLGLCGVGLLALRRRR